MSVRRTALVLALAAMAASTAYAGTASTFVGGEIGFVDQPLASTVSRQQVRQEFESFRRNPVMQDGASLWVGGEMGFVDRPVASTTTRAAVRQQVLSRQAALSMPIEAP